MKDESFMGAAAGLQWAKRERDERLGSQNYFPLETGELNGTFGI